VKRQVVRYDNGCTFIDVPDGGFDVLAVSHMTAENKRNQGRTFFEIMGNPLVYAEGSPWT
jgi:hypothetical protein